MNEIRREELFNLAQQYAQLTVLEESYVKSLIQSTKKSLNKVSVAQGQLI